MLTHLNIRNFAIVRDLDIDFREGMTSVTGETGAGKSIAIDALGLCLGERADAGSVRTGESRAEISALFDIIGSAAAESWFADNGMELEDSEVLIRRTITADGKSRSYINGTPATLAQLKSLGELLVIIHGQHAHQQLFKQTYQTAILDRFGGLLDIRRTVGADAGEIRKLEAELADLEQSREQREARRELLRFQLEELRKAEPREGEYQELEQEYNRLANADEISRICGESLNFLQDGERFSALHAVESALQCLQKAAEKDPGSLDNAINMLSDAQIAIQESYDEIRGYSGSVEADPQRLEILEKRISLYESLAMKYHVDPRQLWEHLGKLEQESASVEDAGEAGEALRQKLEEARVRYLNSARELSRGRKKAAEELAGRITAHMHELAMPHGIFTITVDADEKAAPSPGGMDTVRFLVSINPGQEAGPLNAVVSGGELSRISLAIHEIHAERVRTPTLIFDEVDTGISGQTASVVGRLLASLGNSAQVLCVTHLPQVASRARHQMKVEKEVRDGRTETSMRELTGEERIREIARLLSGDQVTDNALASARDLLEGNC